MKNLIRKILRENNFLSLSGNVIFAVFGLVSFLLLSRSLSKYDFGQWIIYITFATFIDLLRFGLTRTAIIRFISGVSYPEKRKFLGASLHIGIFQVVVILSLFWVAYLFFYNTLINSGYQYLFIYYPILAVANLSWNNALSFLQAEQKFGKILLVRLLNVASFIAS